MAPKLARKASQVRKPVSKKPAASTESNRYEDALSAVRRGEVVTFGEIAVMATGHSNLGALIHAGGSVRKIPTSGNSRNLPWWRAVSTGKRPIGELLQSERADEQRRLLTAEGVDLSVPLARAQASNLPRCLAAALGGTTIQPSAPHTHTLVYLHGRAFTGHYYGKVNCFFQAPLASGLRVVLPTAPFNGTLPTQWFDGWPPSDADLAPGRAMVAAIVAAEVKLLGGQANRVFLGGASQGCILGLDVYMRTRTPLGGFCGCIGSWPKSSDNVLERGIGVLHAKRPVRLLNGAADTVMPWALAGPSFEKLRAAGLTDLTTSVEAGQGHNIGPKEGSHIRKFLEEVLIS